MGYMSWDNAVKQHEEMRGEKNRCVCTWLELVTLIPQDASPQRVTTVVTIVSNMQSNGWLNTAM